MGNLAVSRAFGDAEFKKNISYGVQHDTDATANNSSSSSSSGNNSSTSPDSNEPSVCGPLVIAEPVSFQFTCINLLTVPPQIVCYCHRFNVDKRSRVALQEFAIVQMTAEDDFMVLACDGLFDVYSNKEVVKAVKQEMAAHGDAQKCCENITLRAIKERHTRDNVTMILLMLKPDNTAANAAAAKAAAQAAAAAEQQQQQQQQQQAQSSKEPALAVPLPPASGTLDTQQGEQQPLQQQQQQQTS
eukprot:20300-Heterococcus_DN1.PRE.1